MELHIAKETKGLYIGTNSNYEFHGKVVNEKEFMLGNNLKWTVIETKKYNGKDVLVVEVRND